ncbi:MAG: DUF2807 domain-containing protein [Spirochaetales bacterium]|uniref:DUF2807 domain-containing protein n=1 Tax=Candidatus Thalassospirochaeta sargassi TaxID=3119039 RepID=A0AAJ1ICI9_9SPIO|nr:DUF2807 domain-containing protein [Spirochaetales bacterium]
MKNSNKFILIVLSFMAAVMIVLTVMFRVMFAGHFEITNDGDGFNFSNGSELMLSDEFDYKGFDEIKVVGGWDILVISSSEFDISVDYNEAARDSAEIRKSGDVLYLSLDYQRSGMASDFHGASATIYMPELEAVSVDGAVNLNIENFSGDKLDFDLDGAGQIIGENCSYEQFDIDTNGAVNVDFYDSKVVSADVNIDGAGNVQLRMAGGELSGRLSGLARLEYTGKVSELTVAEDGIANVEYVKNAGN